MRRWPLVTVLAVTAAVAGYLLVGSSHGAGAPPPFPRPLDGALAVPAAEATVRHDATEILIQGCMAEHGFAYAFVPAMDHSASAAANPYGLLDRTRARQDGYGMTSAWLSGADVPAADPNEPLLAGLDDATRERWSAALLGSDAGRAQVTLPDGTPVTYPTDGCVAAASRTLFGPDWSRLSPTYQGWANVILERAQASPGYRAALGQWSRCMQTRDYSYTDLQGPRRAIQDRLDALTGPAATDDAVRDVARFELTVAEADAGCEREARLHEATAQAQATVTQEVLGPTQLAEVTRIRELQAQATAVARSVIAGPTG